MGDIYDLIRRIERVPEEVLIRNQSRLVDLARADQNYNLFGVLVDRIGVPIEDETDQNLYDRYILERKRESSLEPTLNQDKPVVLIGRTEKPSVSKAMMVSWLNDTCDAMNIPRIKGLTAMDKYGVREVYDSFRGKYHISEEDIVQR